MNRRFLIVLLFGAITLSSAMAGVKREGGSSSSSSSSEKSTGPAPSANPANEPEKALLDRLITQLKRSARSFIYLRSIGFNLTDQEFDQLIERNNRILTPTRIKRFDKDGNRQIPGWPAVKLNPEYLGQQGR